jgi:hypothetical protein
VTCIGIAIIARSKNACRTRSQAIVAGAIRALTSSRPQDIRTPAGPFVRNKGSNEQETYRSHRDLGLRDRADADCSSVSVSECKKDRPLSGAWP